ncbi:MAG: cysteine desulfurase family protein [Planctomycetota bacterium]
MQQRHGRGKQDRHVHMIYLDNHATTRLDPRVLDAMLPWMRDGFGNAGSVGHTFGEEARAAVNEARATIAGAIGAEPEEIVFTSGATESNNLAIRGVAQRTRRRGDHLVTAATEHNAVLAPISSLQRRGYTATFLQPEQHPSPVAGRIDPQQVAEAITNETCLVSLMLANNEIGIIQPLAEVSSVCRERGVLLHTDATQAVGKLPVDVKALGVDLMSFTGHKLHGPMGVGALYVRRRSPVVRLDAQITGGGQERGLRGGTLNVPGIVGLAEAVRLSQDGMADGEPAQLAKLRNRLASRLRDAASPWELCGPNLEETTQSKPLRLPANLMIALGDAQGEAVQLACPKVAFSTGAACSSTEPEPSHVLRAIGLTGDQASTALRFGLSRFTTEAEIDAAARAVGEAVHAVRAHASP